MTRDEIMRKSKEEGGMFIVIPSVVQLDAELALSARMLYGVITWKCNKYACTWATNRELGEALGVSAKRVSALLALLEQRGHIETEIEYRDGTREVLCRRIFPIMKSARSLAKDTPPLKNEDTPPSERGYLPPGVRIPPPENAEVICNIKRNKKDTPYSPPAGDAFVESSERGTSFGSAERPSRQPAAAQDKPKCSRRDKSAPAHDPEAFETFWAAYPRKDSRKAAVRAWDKLKPDRTLCREMYIALKRQRKSPQWAEKGGKYIPMFSTWLNGGKWKDQGVDLTLLSPAQGNSSGGWAKDPEVSYDE